jgi:phage replication O-like protein O
MSKNSIEELLKKKAGIDISAGGSEAEEKPKRRPRRMYFAVEEEKKPEPVVEKVEEPIEQVTAKEPEETIEIEKEVKKQVKKKLVKKVASTAAKKSSKAKKIDTKGALKRPTDNFTPMHNEILDFLCTSNLSANEMKYILYVFRETVGWNKDYKVLSKGDILENTSITNNLVYKCKKNLEENGLISAGKDPDSTSNYYFLNSEFFGIKKGKKGNLSVEDIIENDKFEHFLMDYPDAKIKNSEIKKLSELTENYELEEIETLYRWLVDNGDLKGDTCSRPASYLASGTIQAIRDRMGGVKANGLNPQLIRDSITMYSTREKLPEEVSEKLSEQDWAWIESRGGRAALGSMNLSDVERDLGL